MNDKLVTDSIIGGSVISLSLTDIDAIMKSAGLTFGVVLVVLRILLALKELRGRRR